MNKWITICVALAITFMTALMAGPPKAKLDMPTLLCGGSTQTSINIQVCAGPTGAPAGFSIQWMTAEQFGAGGWSQLDAGIGCKASFSGNANLSRYQLAPGQCVTVNVGDFLFDEGASTTCPGTLTCGTQYVFRAFAHATNSFTRSDFTSELSCSTLPCGSANSCTLTQGYWKTHGPIPSGNNENEWPVNQLMLGTVTYTQLELQAIFDTPAAGNGLIALAHQLMAAKLNVATGADPTDVADAIAAADALIGGLIVPPVGSASLKSSVTSALTTTLANYNEGATGPGHCED
ncbi:MAG: hypothetical protein EHM61_14380 [Acidobacteria bacterium]|nr:MAG: hypothetical protein EHM61_14380 [Acidobacteriota bacterium]